jgi:hypothetical protein
VQPGDSLAGIATKAPIPLPTPEQLSQSPNLHTIQSTQRIGLLR